MNTDKGNHDSIFAIGADGIDTEAIVERIRAAVADKMARGAYRDPAVVRAERANLLCSSDDETFFPYYLECLKEAAAVDINDYEIVEKRRFMAGAFIALKKAIWHLLRFYTYRLWSQQNQTNAMLVAAIENMENRHRARVRDLEDRIARLERSNKTA